MNQEQLLDALRAGGHLIYDRVDLKVLLVRANGSERRITVDLYRGIQKQLVQVGNHPGRTRYELKPEV